MADLPPTVRAMYDRLPPEKQRLIDEASRIPEGSGADLTVVGPDGKPVTMLELAATNGELGVDLVEAFVDLDRLAKALGRISDIRDSIIGSQAPNWSLHVYPLVAALRAAGYEGRGYDQAQAELAAIDERIRAEEKVANKERLDRDVAPSGVGGTDG